MITKLVTQQKHSTSALPQSAVWQPPQQRSGSSGTIDLPPEPKPPAWDAQRIAEGTQNNKTYGDTLRGLASQEDTTALDFGIKINRAPDMTLPDGTVVKGKVTGYDSNVFDPANLASNPFSRAALLQKSYQDAQRGTDVGFAARGHLYSGGRQAAQNTNDFGFESNKDAMFKAFQSLLSRYGEGRTTAENTLSGANIASDSGLLGRVTEKPPEVPAGTSQGPGSPTVPSLRYDNLGRLITARSGVEARIVPGKNSKGQVGEWHYYPDGRKVFVKK